VAAGAPCDLIVHIRVRQGQQHRVLNLALLVLIACRGPARILSFSVFYNKRAGLHHLMLAAAHVGQVARPKRLGLHLMTPTGPAIRACQSWPH
jgi:hypothetical protein